MIFKNNFIENNLNSLYQKLTVFPKQLFIYGNTRLYKWSTVQILYPLYDNFFISKLNLF